MRQWLLALYVLSMATLGFAHQPLIVPAAAAPDLSAYALPDGSLPVICTFGEDGKSSGGGLPHLSTVLCDACMLSAAPGLLPCATELPPHPVSLALAPALPLTTIPLQAHGGHVAHLRGPPPVTPAA